MLSIPESRESRYRGTQGGRKRKDHETRAGVNQSKRLGVGAHPDPGFFMERGAEGDEKRDFGKWSNFGKHPA